MRYGDGGSTDDLYAMAARLRRWIIEQSFASKVGHIGSALSVVDIVAALWGAVMRQPGTTLPDRDRFILSKGHAALALYAAMRWKGVIDEETFHSYCRDGSRLGVHPEASLPGVDAATGSLGQGLSVGCGMAYGLRLRRQCRARLRAGERRRVQRRAGVGSGHVRRPSRPGKPDRGGRSQRPASAGSTKDILDLDPLGDKWRAFGWECQEVDGHDVAASSVLGTLPTKPGDRPRVVLARTVLGKGVSFMENRFEWHYRPLSDRLYATAIAEMEAAG